MRIPFNQKQLVLAISLATAASFAIQTQADEASPDSERISIEEILVTAQKREQDMQDTPIAMTAFNAQAMEKQGIADISDAAQYMPNVVISESPGGSTGATASIRGATTGNPAITWEPTVGIYVDGVFVAKNVGGLFDVAEMERLEVLRGPQGTLYGKNTLGGAINLITRKPGDEFSGTIKAKLGNYNYREEFVSIDTGKLGDVASFNIAANKRERDGFYKNDYQAPGVANRFKELDSTSARFAALFDVSDDLEIFYTYDMNKKRNTPPFAQFDLADSKLDKRRKSGALDGAFYDRSESEGHALHITWDATDELSFKSISSYRHAKFDDKGDYDGHVGNALYDVDNNPILQYAVSPFFGQRKTDTKQYSQEFQLIGNYDIVSFVTGLYYFNEDSDAYNPFYLPAMEVPGMFNGRIENRYGVNSESYAIFGQADWMLTDALVLTTGLRWTQEEKEAYLQREDGTPPVYGPIPAFGGNVAKVNAKKKWNNVSPMAALTYFWNDDINTYLKVSQGWKAGGFNGEAGPEVDFATMTVVRNADEVFKTSYKPEKVTAYELGMKARWLDNRLQTNIAYFYHDASEIQLSKFLLGAQTEVINAGKAHIQGVEIDIIGQVTRNLALNASFGFTDAKYKKHGPAENYAAAPDGNRKPHFPYTPKHTASIGLDHNVSLGIGELRTRLDYNWTGSYYTFDAPETAYVTRIKRHGILNGRIALADMPVSKSGKQTLEIGLWGKNLTNEQYRINGIPVNGAQLNLMTNPPSSTGVNRNIGAVNFYGDPRTFGIDLAYKW